MCLAADPTHPGRLYGGTFDDGLWISDDSGKTREPAGKGIAHNWVMSVAVSPTEERNGYLVVWAGTEPSGLFRSGDGGQTWTACPRLLDLPSRSSWSFPP
ncbi:WD40/YVTN/BNR-like repeat-containing protein [Virgibacillus natechei]